MIIEYDLGGGLKVKFDLLAIAVALSGNKKQMRKKYVEMIKKELSELESMKNER